MKDLNKINVIKISISLLFLILFSYSIANVTTQIAAVVTHAMLFVAFAAERCVSCKWHLTTGTAIMCQTKAQQFPVQGPHSTHG